MANQGKLPSQTETSPNANVSVVTLRSGKELQQGGKRNEQIHEEEEELEVEAPTVIPKDSNGDQSAKKVPITPEVLVQLPPFPSRFGKTNREEEEKEILDTFRKAQVNIPLLDAIKQIPRYAKFLKELCMNKKKLKGDEKINLSQNV